jgi:hypothetical protein
MWACVLAWLWEGMWATREPKWGWGWALGSVLVLEEQTAVRRGEEWVQVMDVVWEMARVSGWGGSKV